MVKKVRKYSSSTKLVAGTLGALSVFALTTQANNTVLNWLQLLRMEFMWLRVAIP